jgi:hypothetical protein
MNPTTVVCGLLNLRDSLSRRLNENFADQDSREEDYLRKTLRKFPYWAVGHLALARLGYRLDDAGLCYQSAQAVLQLHSDGVQNERSDEVIEAKFLIGKSHLLRNEYERALATFQSLWLVRQSIALREEIAACYFGMGELKVAYNWLSDIPASEISPEAQAVLNYCRQKGEGSTSDGRP